MRGTNVDTVRVWGLLKLVEQDPTFPFILLSPQTASGTLWTDTELLIVLLDEVSARYAVDTSRIVLTGHSMGEMARGISPICTPHALPRLLQ